jgi:hypothetical protein
MGSRGGGPGHVGGGVEVRGGAPDDGGDARAHVGVVAAAGGEVPRGSDNRACFSSTRFCPKSKAT